MSHRLYFCNSPARGSSWRRRGVGSLSLACHRLAPGPTERRLLALMSTPARSRFAWQEDGLGAPDRRLDTALGELAVYDRGTGPVVLVQHGWSGCAGQMSAIVSSIVRHGFRAVAFDHYRHGRSGGTQAHVPAFVAAARAVVEDLRARGAEVIACAGHSLGCTSALHAGIDGARHHFMVSPALECHDLIRRRALDWGVHPRAFDSVIAGVDREHGFDHRGLDDAAAMRRHGARATVVHADDDPVVPVAPSRAFAARCDGVDLVEVAGRSHSRLLTHADTRRLLGRWLVAQGAVPADPDAGSAAATPSPRRRMVSVSPLW